jgi:hypothetical protein
VYRLWQVDVGISSISRIVGPENFLVNGPVQQQLLGLTPLGLSYIIDVGGISQGQQYGNDHYHDHQFYDRESRISFCV